MRYGVLVVGVVVVLVVVVWRRDHRASTAMPVASSSSAAPTTAGRGAAPTVARAASLPAGGSAPARGPACDQPSTIWGEVRDRHGRPLGGALVTVREDAPRRGELAVTTAPDGTYLVDGICANLLFEVSVTLRGYRTQRAPRCTLDDDNGPVDFALDSGAVLQGQVVPVAGHELGDAFVFVTQPGWDEVATVKGQRFRLEVPEGELAVEVISRHGGRGSLALTLAQGEERDVTVVLTDGVSLSGIVVDEEGRPMGGVAIRAPDLPRTTSADDGRFLLIGLEAKPLEIRLAAPDASARLDVDLTDGVSRAELSIVMMRNDQTLSGRVRSPDGVGFAEQLVVVTPEQGEVTGARTDKDGRFVVEHVTRGQCAVFVQYLESSTLTVDCGANEVDLVLPTRIEGEVVGPIPERAFVWVADDEHSIVGKLTAGRFVVPMWTGRGTLSVGGTDDSGREIVARPGEVVRVRIVLPEERP